MAFGVANQSLPGRGPTPGLRFALYAILAITLMFLDKREGWMEQVRYGLQAAAYPLQLAVSSPSTAWSWMQELFQTRDALREENSELRTRLRNLELRTMRYEALAKENAELRGLSTTIPPVAEKWLVAEVVHAELDSLRPRILINRGASNGVSKAQAVLSDEGVLGQTTHVGPWSAEVILITDPEHAIPVEIDRTGVRTIAVGTGNEGALALPFLPGNADIQSGDTLITSGLGGVFPQGYPVGRVTEVRRDAVQPLAQVRAEPFARINRIREVMLVWFREGHPAAPVRDASGDLGAGDPSVKPQATPPKPKPEAPATAPADGSAAPSSGAAPARPGAGAGPRGTVPTPPTTSPAPRPNTTGSASGNTSSGATTGSPAPTTSAAPRANATGSASGSTNSGAATGSPAPTQSAPARPASTPAATSSPSSNPDAEGRE